MLDLFKSLKLWIPTHIEIVNQKNDLNDWPLNGDSLSQEIKSLTLGLMLRRRQDGALFFTCTRLATV